MQSDQLFLPFGFRVNRESGEFPAGGIGQDVVLIHAASRKKGKKAVRKIEARIGAVFRHLCDGMNQGGVDENQISSLSGQRKIICLHCQCSA